MANGLTEPHIALGSAMSDPLSFASKPHMIYGTSAFTPFCRLAACLWLVVAAYVNCKAHINYEGSLAM